jgi:hypothetical protein
VAAAAFEELSTSNLDKAKKLFEESAKLDPGEEIFKVTADHVSALIDAIAKYQQALTRQSRDKSEIERRRRNAVVADRPNALDRYDNSNQARAEQIRRSADELEQKSRDSIELSLSRIAAELKLFAEITQKQVATGC